MHNTEPMRQGRLHVTNGREHNTITKPSRAAALGMPSDRLVESFSKKSTESDSSIYLFISLEFFVFNRPYGGGSTNYKIVIRFWGGSPSYICLSLSLYMYIYI